MARGIVCVGEFPNGALAALAQGMLQEAGIQADIAGVTVQAWTGGDTPMTGVKLEVRAEDADRARSLLDEVEARIRARVDAEEAPDDSGALMDGLVDAEAVADDDGSPPSDMDAFAEVAPIPTGAPPPLPTAAERRPPRPADRVARRALTCAVFGAWIPLFGLASLALILSVAIRHAERRLSVGGARTIRWAIAWNALGFGLFLIRWWVVSDARGTGSWFWWLWLWF